MAAKKTRPYHKYPFILRGRAEICEFLGISPNTLQAFIDEGAPVRQIGGGYFADKLALRQWFGVKTFEPVQAKGGR